MPKIDVPSQNRSGLTVIGVDPGSSGGVCVISPYCIVKLSTFSDSLNDIWDTLQDAKEVAIDVSKGSPIRVGIEAVHAMPTVQNGKVVRGATSTFNFGLYYGYSLMALTALKLPFERIPPKTWQKAVRMSRKEKEPTNHWKSRLVDRARELYPSEPLWTRPRTKGIQLQVADAILIAHSLKIQYEGRD